MFSTVTIPLSTNIPKARTKEKSTITFNVTPIAFKIRKDMSIERGMATPTNKAFLKPRKKRRTPTTSMIPNTMEFKRFETMSRVLLDWSFVLERNTLEGIVPSAFACSIILVIFSEATKRFSPPCFFTSSITTGEPNSRAYEVVSPFPKLTVATSSRATGRKSSCLIIIFFSSSASLNSPSIRIVFRIPSVKTSPPGIV